MYHRHNTNSLLSSTSTVSALRKLQTLAGKPAVPLSDCSMLERQIRPGDVVERSQKCPALAQLAASQLKLLAFWLLALFARST